MKRAAKFLAMFALIGGLIYLGAQTYIPTMGAPTAPTLGQGSNMTVTGIWPNNTVAANQGVVLTGTTANIGGSLLLLGGCSTGTASVAGATSGMVASASPVNAVANGVQFQAYVSSANTVTVQECALLTITPTATPFNVRVIP